MYEYGQKGKGKINKGEVMIKSCTLIERLNSLLRLSDVWEFYRDSQRNNWRNLKEPLEMLLLLAEDT